MNEHSWQPTVYAWIVGTAVWTSVRYAMLLAG